MGIDRREREILEEDLIEWFKLCPNEEVEKLEVWKDRHNNWHLSAVIDEAKEYNKPGLGIRIVMKDE